MKGFLVGLIVAMVAALGLYYVWFMREAEVQKERGTSTELEVNTKKIPAGAIMEDGTLPE